ncbi:hypothetical protein MNBD_GAMMA16-578 [hydrothermal vent metagenome]|uniref:Right handed beta helix domain-containing protein n=1 Tax=hydrothermal vent metagenome TaxID=652676 RepID=A0A3B0ZZU1_9ZZZZ
MFLSLFKSIKILFFIPVGLIFFSTFVLAAPPKLNFSDLITGPSTGINDGKGSGTIVTIWGQYLGNTQSNSKVIFIDSSGAKKDTYVYYWKNSNGSLPGGPANLYESHKMQEVAFSIPQSAKGSGSIQIIVNGVISNTLPFTVRNGAIYHVMKNGNDSDGNGSFSKPWASIDKALNNIDDPGSIMYVHDSLSTGDPSTKRAIYWNKRSAASGYSNQSGIIAYPNSQPVAIGRTGIVNYRTTGQVISKFSIFTSNCDEGANGQPINCATNPSKFTMGLQTSAYGRGVGNKLSDREGGCASGSAAAITGNNLSRDRVSGYQVLGNEVYEYGCAGTAKFQHTTYLSIRSGSDNNQVDPWRFGWNYLHNNDAKNGIHQYDENNTGLECGSPNGTVIINDNVIINQGGSAINVGANCPWTNDFEIYNNVIKNAGLAADWDGIDPGTSNGPYTAAITAQDGGLMGNLRIYHNTIYSWNDDDQDNGTKACLGLLGSQDNVSILWDNNICYTEKDKPFVKNNWNGVQLLDNVSGDNNTWFYAGSNAKKAIPPAWDKKSKTDDPLITLFNSQMRVSADSPLFQSSLSTLSHDVYGTPRLKNAATVGAIESVFSLLPPPVVPIARPGPPSNVLVR